MTKLYVSGPISVEPRGFDFALANFAEHAKALVDVGYDVVNPFEVTACKDSVCMHDPDQFTTHTWGCYLRFDIIAMLGCDGVATLPGWKRSPGAKLETFVALQVGLAVEEHQFWMDAV